MLKEQKCLLLSLTQKKIFNYLFIKYIIYLSFESGISIKQYYKQIKCWNHWNSKQKSINWGIKHQKFVGKNLFYIFNFNLIFIT